MIPSRKVPLLADPLLSDPLPARVDVVVVGGGTIGCAVARVAARGGARVLVLDDGALAGAATDAAGGMLSPLGETPEPGPFLPLGMRSLRMFPDLVAALERETDTSVELRRDGKLIVSIDPDGEIRLRERMRWQTEAGHDVRWLTADEARDLEPGLSPEIRGALHLREEGSVDNRRLLEALRKAVVAAGGVVRGGSRVEAVARSHRRVKGVRLSSGDRVEADRVVIAAGAWSGRIGGLPRSLPIRPVRGQMVAVGSEELLRRTVETGHVYLVPRGPGSSLPGVWIGATQEEVGFRADTTEAGVMKLFRAAGGVVPGLAGAPVLDAWAGLRPGTPDGLPVLGADPEVQGLLYATGHFRNGILLTPITGASIGALCLGRDPEIELAPFAPDRFLS